MHHRKPSIGYLAFTLIELLVVITIVVILASLILPIFNRVQMKGYETKTLSNMRAMGTALMAYAGDNSYQLPGRVAAAADGTTPDKWPRVLQPYVGDLTVYGAPIPNLNGKSYKVTDPQLYLSNDVNNTCYIYNGGNDSATTPGAATNTPVTYPRLNVIGLPSQTILLGIPIPQSGNFYMDFTQKDNDTILNRAAFADGTPYIFADGSARTLAVDPKGTPETNKVAPISSGTYTDWLWLFDKNRTDIIQ